MRYKSLFATILAYILFMFCITPAGAVETDADGLVAASVVRYVHRVVQGLEQAPQEETAFSAIDLNGDGAITDADVTGMLRLSVGLDAFDLSSRSVPEAEDTGSGGTDKEENVSDRSGGGSSSSDSDYWDKPWGPVPGALPEGETGKYAVNTNTGKFHCVSCKWVSEIYPKNRTDSNADRQEIIDAGYTPCKVCCP